MNKWLIRQEWFGPETFGPDYPMWFAYPPKRNRKPYMFPTWRRAMDYVSARVARGY